MSKFTTGESGALPIVVIDDLHEQVFARVTEEPSEYVIPQGPGFVIDTGNYTFESPWNDDTQPDMVQLLRGDDIYELAFDPLKTIHVVRVEALRVIAGAPITEMREGEFFGLAIGREESNDGGVSFRPFWVGAIAIAS
jgi:hypothetical protein